MKKYLSITIVFLIFCDIIGTTGCANRKSFDSIIGIDSIESIPDTDYVSGGYATFGEISWNDIMTMDSIEKRAFYLSLTDSLPNLWKTRDVDVMSYAVEDTIPSLTSNDVVYLCYNQKVNGYSVWVEFDRSFDQMRGQAFYSIYVGKAILHFSKPQHSFEVFCEEFSDEELKVWDLTDSTFYKKTSGSIDLSEVKGGEKVHLNYTRPKQDEYLSHSSPFYFRDMDYDGEEELVVNNMSMGERGYNTYDVFKVYNVKKPLRLIGLPFNNQSYKITNYNVEYEPKTRSVLDKRYDGFDAYGYYRYQGIQTSLENGLRSRFLLIDAEDMGFYHLMNSQPSDSVVLIQPYKKYQRIDGKIILVEKGVYEIGHYGQNYNKVVIECSKMYQQKD